jgi:hypothetical protein
MEPGKVENRKWKTESAVETATAAQPVRDTAIQTTAGNMKRMNSPVPNPYFLFSTFHFLFSSFHFQFSILQFPFSIF